MLVLDTNVLGELIKPLPNAGVLQHILDARAGSLFACELSRFELRHGAALQARPEHLWARIQALVLPLPTWVAVSAEISERSGEVAAALDRSGRPAGVIDCFVAATALVLGHPLVTHNTRHFDTIDGLELIDWHRER